MVLPTAAVTVGYSVEVHQTHQRRNNTSRCKRMFYSMSDTIVTSDRIRCHIFCCC